MKRVLIDVTNDFLKKSSPWKGRVILEKGINEKTHQKEIETAFWILKTFSGEITVLKEKNQFLISDPDYEWNNKLWDLKNPKKLSSITKRIRKGFKQTIMNRGGIICDISYADFSVGQLFAKLNNEFQYYNNTHALIIVKKNDCLLFVYEINKKRN